MKRLDRLILKSFLGPLVLTFAIAVFVLLMQFLWKYIDDMVGKGLPFGIIMELLFYASVTFVPMALPIAVLFASIMTMGNFGEKYELVAMKAGGVSLTRVMAPMFVVVLMMTGVAYYFSNNMLPVAMTKYKTILFDVTRKKPAINIRPSEYYDELDGYVIRVDEKDGNTGVLRDIVIYDHTKRLQQSSVVVADSGRMQMSPDERYLIFTLNDGHMYSEEYDGENYETRPLTSIAFKEQVLTFDMSSFAFDKSNDDFFSGNYQMMNVKQLKEKLVGLKGDREKQCRDYASEMTDLMRALRTIQKDTVGEQDVARAKEEEAVAAETNDSVKKVEDSLARVMQAKFGKRSIPMVLDPGVAKREEPRPSFADELDAREYHKWAGMEALDAAKRKNVLSRAKTMVTQGIGQTQMYEQVLKSTDEYINRHYIEWHRKYTLSVACLVMFLVGAPFGSIVRKGGLGMPLVASVLFFVIYYVIGMIFEKSVRESAVGIIGMWMSTLVLLPIGMLLTLHASTDGNYTTLLKRWSAKRKTKEAKEEGEEGSANECDQCRE